MMIGRWSSDVFYFISENKWNSSATTWQLECYDSNLSGTYQTWHHISHIWTQDREITRTLPRQGIILVVTRLDELNYQLFLCSTKARQISDSQRDHITQAELRRYANYIDGRSIFADSDRAQGESLLEQDSKANLLYSMHS